MKKQLNNKGFSLVELLVASVVLAVVIMPLLHTFVTSARTAARSQTMGDATLACQNITESLKANDLGMVLTDPITTNYFAAATKGLYSYDEDTEVYSSGAAYTANADLYHLGVTGLEAGSSMFNAMVTLDATAYQSQEEGVIDINDVEIADYSNMDAVFFQSAGVDNPDTLSMDNFRSYADSQHANWSESSVRVFRTMDMTVWQVDTKVYANLVFNYRYTYTYYEEEADGTLKPYSASWNDIYPPTYTLFPQGFSVSNGVLPNIYMMYYPMYGNPSETNDTVVVNNPDALPFKLFLVKEMSDAASATQELQYHANVLQKVPSGTPDEGIATIYSNAKENLLDGTTIASVQYRVQSGNYFSQSAEFAGETGQLVSKAARNRMYQIEIAIYGRDDPNFTGEPIYTFTSAKLQ